MHQNEISKGVDTWISGSISDPPRLSTMLDGMVIVLDVKNKEIAAIEAQLEPAEKLLKERIQELKDTHQALFTKQLEKKGELSIEVEGLRKQIAAISTDILKAEGGVRTSGKINDRVTVKHSTDFEITDSTAAVKFVSDSPALHHYLTVTKDFNAYLKTLDEKHLPTFVKQVSTFSVAISKPKQ